MRTRDRILLEGLLVLAVLVAYHDLAVAGFLGEDPRLLPGNPFDPPLLAVLYAPDRLLWPDLPLGYHALNVVLLIAALLPLFHLVARRHSPLAAAGASLLLAVHPLCVEPVAWIAGRRDLVALLLFVLVLRVEDRRFGARPAVGGIALFVAALVAKSSTVCLPIVLLAWLRWTALCSWRDAVLRAVPYTLLAAAWAIVIDVVARRLIDAAPRPPWPLDAAATIATYAARIVWPADLSPVYPHAAPHETAAAIAAFAAAGALVVAWRRLPLPLRFAAVGFVGALLPVANVVPIVWRFADRYALLALAVLVEPLAALLDVGRRWAVPFVSAAAVAALVVTTDLVPSWRDPLALWDRAVAAQPSAVLGHTERAAALRAAGRPAEAAAEEAIAARRLLMHE